METVAFLFDGDAQGLGTFYGAECDALFLKALLQADTDAVVRTRLFRGDVLLHSMTGRPTNVVVRGRTRSHHFADDRQLRILLGVELATMFVSRTPGLDLYTLAAALLTRSIYAVTCSLPREIAEAVDGALRTTGAAYIAMVRVHPSNPIERQLFMDFMFRDMAFDRRRLLVAVTSEGDSTLLGAHQGLPAVQLSHGELDARVPIEVDESTSAEAEGLLEKLRRKGTRSVREGLLSALMRSRDVSGDIDLGETSESRVNVPESKLVGYSLSDEHPTGRDHAKLFRQLLAVDAEEWRFLRAQLETAIETAEPRNLRIEHDGLKFDALLPVVGRNGRSMIVRTGWIVRRNEAPQLTSAYVAKEHEQEDLPGTPPPVVSLALRGAERWSAIYELGREAGESAASRTVPTPWFFTASIFGTEHRIVEREGPCGGAAVVIPDGRSSFARWLRKQKLGSRFRPTGVAVYAHAPTQSAERAEAYARAMAEVFEANGVYCRVHTYWS